MRIGTASWTDPGFIEDWYPPGLAKARLLGWYAEHFDYVEVNSSFYGVLQEKQVERWIRQTPAGFLFDIKLHKLLSRHSTEAKWLPRDLQRQAKILDGKVQLTPELESAVAKRILETAGPLIDSGKLGAFLLQLSPSFRPGKHRLDELLPIAEVLRPHRLAIELRNRDWMTGAQTQDTLGFLCRHRLAFVNVDAPASEHFTVMPGGDEITDPQLGYLRLHGRDEKAYVTGRTVAERFNYRYSEEELQSIAERILRLARNVSELHAVFNNNRSNFAPLNAERLKQILAVKFPELGSIPPPRPSQPGLL